MHFAGNKNRKTGQGGSKVMTVEEARFPEEESAGKERGALEARLERAERIVVKLQQAKARQAQYAFNRFNQLRTEYEWGRKIYDIACQNTREGVKTLEWQDNQPASADLTGFGFDQLYEDMRGDAEDAGLLDEWDDDDNNSQDTSGFGSRAGSHHSSSKAVTGGMKPSGVLGGKRKAMSQSYD